MWHLGTGERTEPADPENGDCGLILTGELQLSPRGSQMLFPESGTKPRTKVPDQIRICAKSIRPGLDAKRTEFRLRTYPWPSEPARKRKHELHGVPHLFLIPKCCQKFAWMPSLPLNVLKKKNQRDKFGK